ncbi:hypothetical protein AB6A40_004185 [Gnathostoma spinigerum]|uniref:RNA helicase n=1 Tax=Gnathostoma spinigerum TaxID=75299 RepID=A0ABD6EE30_9BILA
MRTKFSWLGLFLNCFGVRNCILNSEMPANSRSHAVQEFNEGKFKHIIASDINDAYTGTSKDERQRTIAKHRARNREIDKESGVSRGIDFHNVSNVINFDFPSSCDIYIHRVGRTARGWNTGVALSFVVSKEKNTFETVRKELSSYDGGPAIHPYEIRMKDLDSFLLRAREALTACTRVAIREARFAEIRQEALKSKKLEGFFAENPREKSALESYAKVHTVSLHNPAISDVPDYMVPKVLRSSQITKLSTTRKQRKPRHRFLTHNQFKHKRKEADPLQTFKA